jgi:Eukaryotic aspartyl protease
MPLCVLSHHRHSYNTLATASMLQRVAAFTFAITLFLSAGGEANKIPVQAILQPNGRLRQPKYLQDFHQGPSRRFNSRSTNDSQIPASVTFDAYQYCAPITVGERNWAQTFNVEFDTTSADFWVYSTFFNVSQNSDGPNSTHTLYDPVAGGSAVGTGATFDVESGSPSIGNVTGIVFHDTITLAGITVTFENVEAAVNEYGNPPVDNACDGTFGLQPLANSTVQPGDNAMVLQDLFFSDFPDSIDIPDEKVFTALLTRPNERPGFFTFGSIDEEAVGNQTINYVDVTVDAELTANLSTWAVSVPEFFVNGKSIPNPQPNQLVIVDTVYPYIFLPDDVIHAIYDPIGGIQLQGWWSFPANLSQADLPQIDLPIGNFSVQLAPTDLFTLPATPFRGFYGGSIQSSEAFGVSVYGIPWMQNVYAVFDLGSGDRKDMRFGVVPRAPDSL